jgi:hypothetical protein
MACKRRRFDEQDWVVLAEHLEKSFDKIKLVREPKCRQAWFRLSMTRERCKIEFRWHPFITGIAGAFALMASLRKFLL